MHAPLQSQIVAPVHHETLFADILPLDRRASRGMARLKALELRASSGLVLGTARFQVRKNRLVVSQLSCQNSETNLGLELVRFLREEARYASADEIWLEVKSDSESEDFYRSCGFRKKGYFRENPNDPGSQEVAIWSLPVMRIASLDRAPLPN